MGRNAKPGINFYRMDAFHHRNKKVRLLSNEFAGEGYYIWSCLLSYAYGTWGYYFDMNDTDEFEVFASDYCQRNVELIKKVIEGAIRRKLFDENIAESSGILTSEMMQEVFVIATLDRRKKGTVFQMQKDWLKLKFGEIPVNIEILHGKTEILHGKNSQSKNKSLELRVKHKTENLKEEGIAPATPAPTEKINSKTEIPEPYWQKLVEAWFEFNKKYFDDSPSFSGKDPKDFKKIVEMLKKRAAAKKLEWTEHNALASLNFFLSIAFNDAWLSKNFLLANLLKQFDKVYLQQNKKSNEIKSVPAVAVITQKDIDYLVERFSECEYENFDRRLIRVEYFDFLQQTGLTVTDDIMTEAKKLRINQLLGTNKGEEIRLIEAYQKNIENDLTQKDKPVLTSIAKRIAVMVYLINNKANETAHAKAI